jgi:hypothetical protein
MEMSGWLEKRGALSKKYVRRYFILDGEVLNYFLTDKV